MLLSLEGINNQRHRDGGLKLSLGKNGGETRADWEDAIRKPDKSHWRYSLRNIGS